MKDASLTWFVIVNPAAGNGTAPDTWERLQPLLDAANIDHQFAYTKGKGHASELASIAKLAGGNKFLVIGGDGTANETFNGMMQADSHSDPGVLGMISSGTGNDWVRTIGSHGRIADIPRSLKACDTVSYDAGRLTYQSGDKSGSRYFLNIAGLGFDGHVAKLLDEEGGFLSNTRFRYWAALLRSLLTYKHQLIRYKIDGESFSYQTMSVAAGIGKYNGGGMKQLPFADYNDGKLDLTIITGMSKLTMLLSLPRLKSGSFTKMKQVKTFQASQIGIESDLPCWVEADGEFLGNLPVHIDIIPDAVRVLRWK